MWRDQGRGWLAMLVVAGCLVTGGASARGDACSECGPPTREDVQQDPDFALERRGGALDYVDTHGGECRIDLIGTPRIQKDRSWLVLRGSGAVWNCPSSTSSDTMTATVTQTDKKEWSLSASSSVSASVLGVGLTAEVVATVAAATTIQEITSISKQMSANYCRMVAWYGYFEVADYSAEVDFRVERRFAWWTKNIFTGATVHRSGEVWIDCGSHTATLGMRAPIAGYFRLQQHPCPDPECNAIPKKDLGWFPPLPNGLNPPALPGDEKEEGEGAEEEPSGEEPEEEEPDGKAPDADDPATEEPDTEEPDTEEPEETPPPPSDALGDAPTGALPDPQASDAASAS